jgi:hypothetical protein
MWNESFHIEIIKKDDSNHLWKEMEMVLDQSRSFPIKLYFDWVYFLLCFLCVCFLVLVWIKTEVYPQSCVQCLGSSSLRDYFPLTYLTLLDRTFWGLSVGVCLELQFQSIGEKSASQVRWCHPTSVKAPFCQAIFSSLPWKKTLVLLVEIEFHLLYLLI